MSTTDNEGRVHIEDDEARAAESSGHMRWVLAIGLLLAIVAMTIAWVSGALSQDEAESAATVTGQNEATTSDDAAEDTDGVTGLDE